MSGKVVAVKMPDFDSRKADAFVNGRTEATAVPMPTPQVRMKRFTIDVPVDLHTRVKIACAKRGINMADELRRILEREFPKA